MAGQLVQICRPIDSSSELMILVGTLRQEVADLRAEVQRLQRENLELRQQVGYWKSRHRDVLHRITELEKKVEQLEGEKHLPSVASRRTLLRQVRGASGTARAQGGARGHSAGHQAGRR